MKKCLLCLEVVDLVNEDGLCEECLDFLDSEYEAYEDETYIEEGEE